MDLLITVCLIALLCAAIAYIGIVIKDYHARREHVRLMSKPCVLCGEAITPMQSQCGTMEAPKHKSCARPSRVVEARLENYRDAIPYEELHVLDLGDGERVEVPSPDEQCIRCAGRGEDRDIQNRHCRPCREDLTRIEKEHFGRL